VVAGLAQRLTGRAVGGDPRLSTNQEETQVVPVSGRSGCTPYSHHGNDPAMRRIDGQARSFDPELKSQLTTDGWSIYELLRSI
jgi:hypothetical protein